jgi:molybdopterin-containing oxidoreductase family iron-sulfur binding subunit
MARYGMVIDLDRCMGCHSCTVACRQENATPPGIRWTKVVQVDEGEYPNVRRTFVPRGCMHCGSPPCVDVCPTGASYKRRDGLVLVDHSSCIGCKACMVACPYEARHYMEQPAGYFAGSVTAFESARRPDEHPQGTVGKCTFCVHRLEKGLQPACIDTCPAHARFFGDLDDPASEVHRLSKDPRASQPSPEWGTDPSVYYLLPYVRDSDCGDADSGNADREGAWYAEPVHSAASAHPENFRGRKGR